MPNFDKKPEGMSYAQWLREKNVGIKVNPFTIHTDSGLPKEYIDYVKTPQAFEMAKKRQGKVLEPEDIGEA
jgi:hypothetical protein